MADNKVRPFEDNGSEEIRAPTHGGILFDPRRSSMSRLDKDGDGVIDQNEITQFLKSHDLEMAEKRTIKRVLIGVIIFSCVLLAMIFMLIEVTKESRVQKDNVMRSSTTGDPVQCANTDMLVVDGVLTSRSSSLSISSSRRILQDESAVITDALATRRAYSQRSLSSTMPDSFFKELDWIEFHSKTSATLNLKISGIVRIPSIVASCGSYLKLVTGAGTIVLDDADIFYDSGVVNILAEAGYSPIVTSQGATPSKSFSRKLNQGSDPAHHTYRQLSNSDISVVGFFNKMNDEPWTCTSVDKPDIPTEYSAKMISYSPCYDAVNKVDTCSVAFKGDFIVPPFGIIQLESVKYMAAYREMLVTPERTLFLETRPDAPGITFVTSTDTAERLTTTYQVDDDGTVSQCRSAASDAGNVGSGMPNDFVFYYEGLSTDGLMRNFRISQEVQAEGNTTSSWVHYNYFDDVITHLPKLLMSDSGEIFEFTEFKTTPDYGMVSRVNISSVVMWGCSRLTAEIDKGKFGVFDDDDESNSLRTIWNYSYPYPPDESIPLRPNTVDYYHDKLCGAHAVDAHVKWCQWAETNYLRYDQYRATLPTPIPSAAPSVTPTISPSMAPTEETDTPTFHPTMAPSFVPTAIPTIYLNRTGFARRLFLFDVESQEELEELRIQSNQHGVDFVDAPLAEVTNMGGPLFSQPHGDNIHHVGVSKPVQHIQAVMDALSRQEVSHDQTYGHFQSYAMKMNIASMSASCDPLSLTVPVTIGRGFSIPIAKIAATAAGVSQSYANYENASYVGCLAGMRDLKGFLFTTQFIDVKGFVGVMPVESANVVIVAIKGFASLDDFDRDVFSTAEQYIGGPGLVNTAFHKSVRGELFNFVKSRLEVLNRQGIAYNRVVFTGLNVGGAIATLLAVMLKDLLALNYPRSFVYDVYSFGAPRVGGKSFVDHVHGRPSPVNIYRLTRYSDPVPNMLPYQDASSPYYTQFRGEIYETADGRLIDCGISDYQSTSCSAGMDAFLLSAQSVYFGISMGVTVEYDQHVFPDECNPSLAPVFEDEGSDFCWLNTYSRQAKLPDVCPNGRYLYGGLCYRNCQNNYRPATQIDMFCYQNCPSGYIDTGLLCNNPRSTLRGDQFSNSCSGTYGKFFGGLCYHNSVDTRFLLVTQTTTTSPCPSGTTDTAGSCWKCTTKLFGKCIFSVITVPLHQRVRASCRDGYSGPVMGLCAAQSIGMKCPTNYYNTGLLCQAKPGSPSTIQCNDASCGSTPLPWGGDGINPIKPSYNRGVGTIPTCASGWENIGGICYKNCDQNSRSVFALCVLRCPPGYVDCGLGCAINDLVCGVVVGSQIMSVGILGLSVVDFFAPGTSAVASTAGSAGLESAKASVKLSLKAVAATCRQVLAKIGRSIMNIGVRMSKMSVAAARAKVLGQTAVAAEALTSFQKLKIFATTVRKLYATVDTSVTVVENEGASIEDSLQYAGVVTAAVGIGGRLIPGVSMAFAAVDVGIAFTSPICWSTLFYQWKQPIGETNPVASQALADYCSDRTTFSEDFFTDEADGTETPFDSYNNPQNNRFQIQSVRKFARANREPMCMAYGAAGQALKLTQCSTALTQSSVLFKFSYGLSDTRGIVLKNALIVTDGTDQCVRRRDNDLERDLCTSQSVLKFEFIKLYDSDESMLIRLLPSSEELCISDDGFDNALHTERKLQIAACDAGSINQWFKIVIP